MFQPLHNMIPYGLGGIDREIKKHEDKYMYM